MRARFFPLLCLVLLVGAGCREKPVPDFNRLPVQLTEEFFAAAGKRDAPAAERTMSRLQDLFPDQLFFSVTNRQLRLASCLRTVNDLLRQGRVNDARTVTAEGLRQLGSVPELKDAQEILDLLHEVELYLVQLPFKTSSKADIALQNIRQRQKLLSASPLFRDWLRDQETMIQHLQRQEIDRELQRLLALYDTRVFRHASEADALLAQIVDLAASGSTSDLALLLKEQPVNLGTWLQRPDLWTSASLKPAMEIILYRDWQRTPATVLDQFSTRRLPADPATVCGIALRVRLAIREANYGRVLAWSERLTRQTAIPGVLIEEGLRAVVGIAPADSRTRPWGIPFPTATDYLERLHTGSTTSVAP